MKITGIELAQLRDTQGQERGLLINEENNQPVLIMADANFWAYMSVAEMRRLEIDLLKDARSSANEELSRLRADNDKLMIAAQELQRLLDELQSIYVKPTEDNTAEQKAVWDESATSAGAPFRAHQTTEGWTIVDKTSTMVLWDSNGSGLQFAPEIICKRLATEWNIIAGV